MSEVKNWEDVRNKYKNEERSEMTEEREREFVEDCFTAYETEGFAKMFWTRDIDYKQYVGQTFKVASRAKDKTDDDKEKFVDLETLPMWRIKFTDGTETLAFPDEIIAREMKDNGCTLENI